MPIEKVCVIAKLQARYLQTHSGHICFSARLWDCPMHDLRWNVVILKGDLFLLEIGIWNLMQQSDTAVPSQHCVIVSRWMDLFCFFEITHGLAKKTNQHFCRAACSHLCLCAALAKESGIIESLIRVDQTLKCAACIRIAVG